MIHVKIYEDFKTSDIKIGEYVLVYDGSMFLPGASENQKKLYKEFLNNNIGQVINVNPVHNNIKIRYYNVDFNIVHLFNTEMVHPTIMVHPKWIIDHDENPENLKIRHEAKNIWNI